MPDSFLKHKTMPIHFHFIEKPKRRTTMIKHQKISQVKGLGHRKLPIAAASLAMLMAAGMDMTPAMAQTGNPSMPVMRKPMNAMNLAEQAFEIRGDVLVAREPLEEIVKSSRGKPLSIGELESLVHKIAGQLRKDGHADAKVKISRSTAGTKGVSFVLEGLSPTATAYAKTPEVKPTLNINGFRLTGLVTATESELASVLAPFKGKPIAIDQLQEPAKAVADALRAKGMTLAQASVPPQKFSQGILEIAVQEGVIDGSVGQAGIVVKGAGERVREDVVAGVLSAGAPAGQALKAADLETSVIIANELPGIGSVKVDLLPGSKAGTTQVLASVVEAAPVSGSVWVDNYGSVYAGQNRLNAQLAINSLTGHADQLTLFGSTSSGAQSGKLAWSFLLDDRGSRMGLSTTQTRLDLGTQVIPVKLDGYTNVNSLFGSTPIHRSALDNVYFSASLDRKEMENKLDGQLESHRKIGAMVLGLSGTHQGAGMFQWSAALTSGRVNNLGELGQLVARSSADAHFSKINYSLGYVNPVEIFDEPKLWKAQWSLTGQAANANLDTAEKFQLGGPTGIRAYPVGEAYGDAGAIASFELHRDMGETSMGQAGLFGFVDTGTITQSHSGWGAATASNTRPNNYNLSGWGLGVSLAHTNGFSLKAMYASKIGNNPNKTAAETDSDGRNRNSRLWLLGTLKF